MATPQTIGNILAAASERITRQTTPSKPCKFPATADSFAWLLAYAYAARIGDGATAAGLDDYTKTRIRKVSRWITDPSSKISLLLYGGVGTGKTTLVYALYDAIRASKEVLKNISIDSWGQELKILDRFPSPTIVSAQEIADKAAVQQGDIMDQYDIYRRCSFLAVDDLGIEPATARNYGTEVTPMTALFFTRYNEKLRTIITTNLDLKGIEAQYGERVVDRLVETYDFISYSGKSFREKYLKKK